MSANIRHTLGNNVQRIAKWIVSLTLVQLAQLAEVGERSLVRLLTGTIFHSVWKFSTAAISLTINLIGI